MERRPLWTSQDNQQDHENRGVKLGFYLLRLAILAGLLFCILKAGSAV